VATKPVGWLFLIKRSGPHSRTPTRSTGVPACAGLRPLHPGDERAPDQRTGIRTSLIWDPAVARSHPATSNNAWYFLRFGGFIASCLD
jgi:hypothetical protein